MLDFTRLSFLDQFNDRNFSDQFEIARIAKGTMGIDDLCGLNVRESEVFKLKPFVKEVMKLSFNEQPDYNHLRFLLSKPLLEEDLVPGKDFDWIPLQRKSKSAVKSSFT